jgi:hypothetical protein
MVLAAADGSVVPIIVSQPATSPGYAIQTTFVLAPVEPLQPNTQYIVYSAFATVPCVQNDYWNSQLTLYYHLCTPVPDGGAVDAGAVDAGAVDAGAFGAPAAISAFTTGDGPDLTSPVLSGGITTAAEPQSCSASPCCGPFDGFSVTLQWTEATDNGPVLYELSREGVTVLYPLYPGDGNPGVGEVQGAFLCSGSKTTSMVMSTGNPSAEAFQGQPGRYQVVAVDQAGNRSAPIGAKVNVDCGGGCSCRLAARRDGCAGFALVGLALAIGVRRKRSRSVCLPSSTARR